MKFVDNIKKLLFDEEDEIVEEEIKPIPVPVKEEKQETSEKDLYKSPSTFKFPVIFEEEDLKPKESVETKKYVFDKNKIKDKDKKVEEKKFIPSPIISPIYGILDKNYKKDEIQQKTEMSDNEIKRTYRKVDIDSVRQKAFGTLEDDLEQTILEDRGFIYGLRDEEEDHEEVLSNELGIKEEPKVDVTLEEAYENYSDYGHEYKKRMSRYTETEEKLQKTEVLEEELFSLINSMYKDEESEDDL